MDKVLRILFLEDSPVDAELNEHMLKKSGLRFESHRVETEPDFLDALETFSPNVILADYHLPRYDGVQALAALRRQDQTTPFIFVTGAMGEETAVDMLHQGASDYILKDRLTRLPQAVTRALEEAEKLQALEESEERYLNASRSIRDAFIVMDGTTGTILEWNPAAERIFGYGKGEVWGKDLHDMLVPTRFHDAVRQSLEQFTLTGTGNIVGKTLELPALHKDGYEFPVELSLSAYQKGEQWLAVGLVRDIRERKEAEEQLRKNQANLAQAQQIAHLGSWELDHATDRLEWSDEVYRIFEIDPADSVATYETFLDNLHPEDRDWVDRSFTESVREKTPYDIEHRLLMADGRVKYVNGRCETSYDEQGRPIRSIGTVQNVTEQKKASATLAHQANRAEALLDMPTVAERMDEKTFMQYGQELAEDLTGSRISFLHSVDEDEQSIELVTWSRRTLADFCHADFDSHYPVRQAGIWADALRQRRPVVFNDYAAYPHKHGLPEGHAELTRLISVPVIENGKVVMLTGVGNKDSDYTDLDVETVQLIANEIWRIVQRRRAVTTLGASEERYRELVESMSDGVAVYQAIDDGEDFLFREHNRAGERITGLPRDQVVGRSVKEVFPSVETIGLLDILRRVWRHGEPLKLPSRQYRDGRIRLWVENFVFKLTGGEIVAVYNDITQRKQAEEDLQRNHQTQQILNALLQMSLEDKPLKEILEDALDIILSTPFLDLMKKAGIFLTEDGSLRLAAHRGLPSILQERCKKIEFGQCLCGLAASSGEILFTDCVDERHVIDYEGISPHGHYNVPILRAGKTIGVIVLYLESGHRDSEQEKEFLRAIANTMTGLIERKQMEGRLHKLAQAVEQSSESIAITNLEAEIEYVNETFVRNTGYSREEALGQNPRILQSGRTPAATYREMWENLTHGRPWKGELYNRRKDGSEYVEFATITPLRQPDGSISHYVAVKEDISEKKRLGQELDQHRHHLEELVELRTAELRATQQQAERLARVKSDFLANMSHEIRTPLNAVLGFAQVGLRDNYGRNKAQELFSRIQDSGQLLLGVVDDILDFSKIEAGKLAVEQRELHLRGLLKQVAEMTRSRIPTDGPAFELELAEDLPASCLGDRLRLTQVLMNLLSNAVKFTKRGRITLQAGRDDGELVFWVQDSGIGMSGEQIKHLFVPFEQADGSITREFGGTGLGLTITKRLLELMDGSIRITSEPGRGSRFEVRLPLLQPAGLAIDDEAENTATPAMESSGQLAGVCILVAEDNEVNRLVLEDMLMPQGCRLEQVEDGAKAVQRIREMGESHYNLVLMDVQMPVMDGYRATREILKIAPRLPVIGLTAHAMAEAREKCLAAGMVEHVTKPIVLDNLLSAILKQTSPAAQPRLSERDAQHPDAVDGNAKVSLPGNTEPDILPLSDLKKSYPGREDFLQRLLGTFLRSNRDRPDRLRKAAAMQDFEQLALHAHSVKGTSSPVVPRSLRVLAEKVEKLAKATEREADLPALTLATGMDQLLDEIAAYLKQTPPAAPADGQEPRKMADDRLRALLAELETLLARDDTMAIGLFKQFERQLTALAGPAGAQLGRQIEDFDFQAALSTLRRLKEHGD